MIGTEFTTNEGYQVIIIDYINAHKVQVMFLDEHKWTTWTQMGHLKRGKVKNPFHPSVNGVGYLGTNENKEVPKTRENGKLIREYQVWSNMLKRCYSEIVHETHPTYKNCTVCDRWKCYSYFLEDIVKIKGYEKWLDGGDYELNKDTYYAELGINTDCKEYSLVTTRFIDKPKNIQTTHTQKVRCIELDKIYDSVKQASEELGISHGNISQVCSGKRQSCGGYTWEYVENNS